MNDLARGALEALAWVRGIAENTDPANPRSWNKFLGEIESAKEDILHGAAVDFRLRLRVMK